MNTIKVLKFLAKGYLLAFSATLLTGISYMYGFVVSSLLIVIFKMINIMIGNDLDYDYVSVVNTMLIVYGSIFGSGVFTGFCISILEDYEAKGREKEFKRDFLVRFAENALFMKTTTMNFAVYLVVAVLFGMSTFFCQSGIFLLPIMLMALKKLSADKKEKEVS